MKKNAIMIDLAQRPAGLRRNFAQVPEMPAEIPVPKERPAARPAAPDAEEKKE